MKSLIIGARGAIGRATASALRRAGHSITLAGRSAFEGGTAIDLSTDAGLAALREAASVHDVVINASGVEDPRIAGLLGGAVLVDASATAEYLARLSAAAVSAGAGVVIGAGLAPGLSSVLVAAIAHRPGDEVDLAIVLGAGETHGTAAVEWTASSQAVRCGKHPRQELCSTSGSGADCLPPQENGGACAPTFPTIY